MADWWQCAPARMAVRDREYPEALRCPEKADEGEFYRCKVLGPHEVHRNGHGTSWYPLTEKEDRMDEWTDEEWDAMDLAVWEAYQRERDTLTKDS